jgi:putative flippase GtrA
MGAKSFAVAGTLSSQKVRHFLFVRHRHNWSLLVRFGIVGGSGVVVNLLVFGLLLATSIVPQAIVFPIVSTDFNVRWYHAFSSLSFVLANLWNFQLNRVWTFQSAGRTPWLREYGPFVAVGLLAQALSLCVLTILLHPHSAFSLPDGLFDGSSMLRSRELWAQALTIGMVTPVSFVGNKLWTFRAMRGVPGAASRLESMGEVAAVYAPAVTGKPEEL